MPLDRPSKIVPHLWQGGYLSPGQIDVPLALHVACAAEIVPSRNSAREVVHLPLHDQTDVNWVDLPDWRDAVTSAAELVALTVQRKRDTLATCHLGLNRSGLVVALALCKLGFAPDAAIAMIRWARGHIALSNPRFVEAITTLGRM
jgi:protein-tyrosine phosphatase